MKKMRTKFLTVLLLMAFTFLLIPRFLHGAFGKESMQEPCWPIYQTLKDALSHYSEVLRAYSFPPAWDDSTQERPPTHQAEAKLESRSRHYV